MSLQPPGSLADLPAIIRLFPLEGALLLPRAAMPLNIFEPRYLAMVTDAMASDQMVAMIQPRADALAARPPLYRVGTIGRITQYSETGDGRFFITLTGLARFRLVREQAATTPYRQAEADYTPYQSDWSPAAPLAAAARADVESTLRHFLDTQDLSADWDAVRAADDESLVNTLCSVCPFTPAERQALLEAPTLADRTSTLTTLMRFARGETSDETLQ
jgi:Lon protease-like protein